MRFKSFNKRNFGVSIRQKFKKKYRLMYNKFIHVYFYFIDELQSSEYRNRRVKIRSEFDERNTLHF